MWGQISGVAGQFKKTINAVASEIKDAVEEVRGLDEEPASQSAGQLGQDVPKAASAPSSLRGVRVGGTSSRLEAIKARLEAERAGTSRQPSGAAPELSQPSQHGHNQDQEYQTSQKAEVAASPIIPETDLHPANNDSAQSWMAQAQGSADAGTRQWQTGNVAPGSSSNGPLSTGRAPAQRPVMPFQSTERPLHVPKAPAPALQSGPDHADKLRSQVQHLKAELVATAAAHEDEEARLAEDYEQRIRGAEAKHAELARQLESAKAADHHARIMELQVRLKEEQAEKARLLDQIASAPPSRVPDASGAHHPEVDDDAFWSSIGAAGPAHAKDAEASRPGADASSQMAALHEESARTRAEADEQLRSEIVSHAETQAALQGQTRQRRELEEQLHAAQAALQSEQSARRGTQEELSRAQALQAELQERLACRDAADQPAAEAASQVRQAEVQGLQAEITQLNAATADAELRLQEEQQQHLQSLQALEEAQAGQCAAVAELESERAKYVQQHNALQELQHAADRAAENLAAEQASHADTERKVADLQSVMTEAQSASAQCQELSVDLAAARKELDAEKHAHARTKAEAQQLREQAAEPAAAEAAAEHALKLRAELHQALEELSQQREQAGGLEETLPQSRHDSDRLRSLVAELSSKCAQLQEELDNGKQQLNNAEQDSKAALAAQLSQHEVALRSTQQNSEQKLQQALREVEGLKQEIQNLQAAPGQEPAHPDSNGHGTSINPLYVPGNADAAGLKEKLAETEQELERTKQQLQRLKQATVMRQEDEEDSVRWRVEAEVRLAVDRAQQAAAQQEAQMHKDLADLQADLAHAREQLDRQSGDLCDWRNAIAAKDLEIQNLQAALGELAYKSEAAERLRLDVRSQAAKLREAEERCHSTEQALEASKASEQALEQRLIAAAQQAERQRDLEQRLSDEAAMLRRALSQSMHQLKLATSDAGAMVDRRIVTKLLLTWVERGRNDQSVLNLMASMLGFTEDEKKTFGIAQGPGLIKAVAGAPIALIKGLANSGDGTPKSRDGLADQWVEFLIEQANAADAVQPAGRSRSTSLEQNG